MCLYTKLIKNRRYTKTKKNGGQVPPVIDRRIEYVPVGCGNCIECRKQKSREWQVRLQEDIKTNTNGKFITLTFSDESIKNISEEYINKSNKEGVIEKIQIKNIKGYERDNAIATWAVRHFVERWRKEYKTSVRHWLITELGHKGTENIHIHGIIWTNETIAKIRNKWNYGYIWPRKEDRINYVNARTVNYIVKYISKTDNKHKEYKGRILTSPGIGRNYIQTEEANKNAYKGSDTEETYRTNTGHKISLPIYYRNKIYTEIDKERLWIQRLDKEIRWVCGEQVDVSKGEEKYNKMVQWHRQRNATLGYGNRPNENRKEHEEANRNIMYETRIRNTIKKAPSAGSNQKGLD